MTDYLITNTVNRGVVAKLQLIYEKTEGRFQSRLQLLNANLKLSGPRLSCYEALRVTKPDHSDADPPKIYCAEKLGR